jgi:hypothetical protein
MVWRVLGGGGGGGGPQLSHLFFADDSLFFCQATKEESETLLANLKLYEKASGQLVSMEKTSPFFFFFFFFFFSRNTSEKMRDGIKECIGVPKIKEHEKYLGLPSFVGRAKYRTFSELKEKVWKRVNGCKEQLLSQAGHEILIKVVAQSMPTYTMNCFLLPKKLQMELQGIVRQFWWVRRVRRGRSIGWLGIKCACLNLEGAWVFVI